MKSGPDRGLSEYGCPLTHQKHITYRSMPLSSDYLSLIKDRKMQNLFHVVCHRSHVLLQDEFVKKIPALFITLEILG